MEKRERERVVVKFIYLRFNSQQAGCRTCVCEQCVLHRSSEMSCKTCPVLCYLKLCYSTDPATISRISPVQSVDEGNEVAFVCEADAYPVVPNMFTWFREGFDLSRFRAKQEGKYSTLKIRHLKREDAGKFKCTVDNQIGSPSYRSAELIVRCAYTTDVVNAFLTRQKSKGFPPFS